MEPVCVSGDKEGRMQGAGATQEKSPSSLLCLTDGNIEAQKGRRACTAVRPQLLHLSGSKLSSVCITDFSYSLDLISSW